MQYRDYGRTGKKVSLLGLGGSRFPLSEAITPAGQDKYAKLAVEAYNAGINYFDTAPEYCGKQSEYIFGLAFKDLRAHGHTDFYISTKSMLAIDQTADAVRRRIEASLNVLNENVIHFYHMWGILSLDQYAKIIAPGGPYWGAVKAKEEGLIEHICFSTHCTGEEIETIVNDGYFEGVTLGFNILNFKFREKGLQAAQNRGLGVAVMNPLGGGVIPQNASRFGFIAEKDDSTAQAALRFVASQPAVSTVLSGMLTSEELEENSKVFTCFEPFSSSQVADIANRVTQELDTLCTGCNYCSGCPQNINIYKLLLSYNQYILSGKDENEFLDYHDVAWAFSYKHRFECIECGECEKKCTQHLPIRERINEINRIIDALPANKKEAVEAIFSDRHTCTIGIYAIGNDARQIMNDFETVYGPPDFPLFLFDSNEKKWGQEPLYPGIPIRSPDEIERLGIQKMLVASRNFYNDIVASLGALQKKGVRFVKYRHFDR